MHATLATNRQEWDAFVKAQPYASFLQAWNMGEVYRDIGQEPIRIEVRDAQHTILGVCLGVVVPARRGKHVMTQYGPLATSTEVFDALTNAMKDAASERGCSFVRMSPFLPEVHTEAAGWPPAASKSSPLHLLSEYTWYIPLTEKDRWAGEPFQESQKRTEDQIKADMRKTTRNLVGRAQREGVTVEASKNPEADLEMYFELEKETFKRHHFVPYRSSFIRAQVKHFAPQGEAIVYIARYQGQPLAASVHMSFGGITSYHHGASTHAHPKIPASYLLQWTAISDALERGDQIYNFWGIAPRRLLPDGQEVIIDKHHPFAGVTTFKTGFGGKPLPLVHCTDIPLAKTYYLTRAFEFVRKWKRGF